jgi:L-iditol 2-dehydrogenase
MLAAFYYSNQDIRVKEIPIPKIGNDELLLKVMACGICGSDIMEWYRIPKAPIVLGHEAVGIIHKVGKKVKDYKVGNRVFVSHHVPCNKCEYCESGSHTACATLHHTNYYPGGFSQYIRVPKINIQNGIKLLPDQISFDEGTFIEPLACVIRGQKTANLKKKDSALIIGCGVSGILHISLAKDIGVKKIFAADINPYRLKLAKKFGANFTIDATKNIPNILKQINNGKLADKIIVCTGASKAADTALKCVDKGGTILFFAVPKPSMTLSVPINQFWRNEITIKTSYGAAPLELSEALEILSLKNVRVKEMITHRYRLEQISKGFEVMVAADRSLKVLIEPNKIYSN